MSPEEFMKKVQEKNLENDIITSPEEKEDKEDDTRGCIPVLLPGYGRNEEECYVL